MRSNTKEVIAKVQEHIKSRLLDKSEINNGLTALQAVEHEFKHWYCEYEQRRCLNRQKAFSDWLLGLPSCLSLEYTSYSINGFLESLNLDKPKRKITDDDSLKLYHYLVYREFNKMLEKEGNKQ